MDLERYEIDQVDEFNYRFFSKGPKGIFEMRISFAATGNRTYNLGFGVIEPDERRLDDLIELRNSDTQKILATVANSALVFLEEHPTYHVHATGSTPSRTRLYQMGINRILPELIHEYAILGFIAERNELGETLGSYPEWKGAWCELRQGISYDGFLIFKL